MKTLILFLSCVSLAQAALTPETIQLQQLINKSEEQIQQLKELLVFSKRDAANLDRANKILQDLTVGLDVSIEKYRGTAVYERALLLLQSKGNYENTYSDSERVRQQIPKQEKEVQATEDKFFSRIKDFQKQSVLANEVDLKSQNELQNALVSAGPGFLPKIQTQAQLGNWQASTRLSAQLTELLAAVHAMREELRNQRLKDSKATFNTLLLGAEQQNLKQRRVKN